MIFPEKEGGGSRNASNMLTNSRYFADKEGGGGQKIMWTSVMAASFDYEMIVHDVCSKFHLEKQALAQSC